VALASVQQVDKEILAATTGLVQEPAAALGGAQDSSSGSHHEAAGSGCSDGKQASTEHCQLSIKYE
jgi:hypothetical protein